MFNYQISDEMMATITSIVQNVGKRKEGLDVDNEKLLMDLGVLVYQFQIVGEWETLVDRKVQK